MASSEPSLILRYLWGGYLLGFGVCGRRRKTPTNSWHDSNGLGLCFPPLVQEGNSRFNANMGEKNSPVQ